MVVGIFAPTLKNLMIFFFFSRPNIINFASQNIDIDCKSFNVAQFRLF